MGKFLALLFVILVLISSCATRAEYHINIPNTQQDASFPPEPLHEHQVVYVDRAFSLREMQLLSDAAEEWNFATKGMVDFTFVWDYPVYDRSFEERPNQNIVVKTWSNVHFVQYVDSTLEKGKIALAFLHRPSVKWPYWYMGLVRDRVGDDLQIKSVFEHELGHAIGLDHQDDELSIMSSGADERYGCLTRHDILQFCDHFSCKVDKMNYCIPLVPTIKFARNNP